MICYIDTFILVAYYCPELLSDQTEKFLLALETAVISVFTKIEFISVISKKLCKKELSRNNTTEILKHFKTHIDNYHYKKVEMKENYYKQVKQWLGDHIALGTLDALHLAIAATENIPLITADKKLANVGKRAYRNITLIGG